MLRPLVVAAGIVAILLAGGLAGAQVPSFAEQQAQLRTASAAACSSG